MDQQQGTGSAGAGEVEVVGPDTQSEGEQPDPRPKGSASKGSAPNGSTPNGSASYGSTPNDSAPRDSAPNDSAPKGSTPNGPNPVGEVEAHINGSQETSTASARSLQQQKQEKYPHLNRGGNTPDNAFGAGAPRSEVRVLDRQFRRRLPRAELRDLFCDRLPPALQLCDELIALAQNGELRTTEIIKLLDVIAKYSVGPVQTQEHTGEGGGAVKVQFSFGGAKPEAQAYVNSIRQRLAQQSTDDQLASDNDHSDTLD